MEFILKGFNDLSNDQLFEIYKLRSEVFIVEQNCAYQDVDDIDKKAQHLLLMMGQTLAAYARIIPPGISYNEPSIGRVVVKKQYRGKDLGKILMKSGYLRKNYFSFLFCFRLSPWLPRSYRVA